jgi:hypothetical protein
MSNFKDKYRLGVGKTVLELFKKVLEKKQELQIGGAQNGTQQKDAQGVQDTDTTPEVSVNLTKVEQYYDGTIFEGTIDGGDNLVVHFNIKDRTKTTLPIE